MRIHPYDFTVDKEAGTEQTREAHVRDKMRTNPVICGLVLSPLFTLLLTIIIAY